VLAAEGQDREADEDEDRERGEDNRARSVPVVQPAADHAADRPRHGEQDTEDAELRRSPAEHAGAVDAAEGEQRHQAVLVDHVGEKEAGHRAVPSGLLHRPAEMGERLAEGRPDRASRGRRVRREEEQRGDEREEPPAARGPTTRSPSRLAESRPNSGSRPR
jgi:hypothetical protein